MYIASERIFLIIANSSNLKGDNYGIHPVRRTSKYTMIAKVVSQMIKIS